MKAAMHQEERPSATLPTYRRSAAQAWATWFNCRAGSLLVAAGVVLSFSGCVLDPRFVRLPELMPRHPAIEQRAAEYHDPFPDESIGPSTGNRPLGFHRQRTPARRAADLRGVHLLDSADRLPPTSAAPPKKRFTQVVEP